RSRSGSTARPCCWPPRSAAPSAPPPCGAGSPATAPASPPPTPPWTGTDPPNSPSPFPPATNPPPPNPEPGHGDTKTVGHQALDEELGWGVGLAGTAPRGPLRAPAA